MGLVRVRLTIDGQVQGVGFRFAAQRQARALHLGGWVGNTRAGTVEAEVEGTSDAVRSFVEWANVGPSGAHVNSVSVEDSPLVGETEFRIRTS